MGQLWWQAGQWWRLVQRAWCPRRIGIIVRTRRRPETTAPKLSSVYTSGIGAYGPNAQYLGQFTPSYWNEPSNVVTWYTKLQSNPNRPLPDGMDADTLTGIYKYMQMKNGGRTPDRWLHLGPEDKMRDFLAHMPRPGDQYLTQSERRLWGGGTVVGGRGVMATTNWQDKSFNWLNLTTEQKRSILSNPYFRMSKVASLQQQGLIVSDPLFDWSKVPAWQKPAFYAQSNPMTAPLGQAVIMGAPAVLGGLATGGPGAAAVGGAMAFGAPLLLGYGEMLPDKGLLGVMKGLMTRSGWALMVGSQAIEQAQSIIATPEIPAGLKGKAYNDAVNAYIEKHGGVPGMVKGALAGMIGDFSRYGVDISKLSPETQKGYALWESGKVFYETRPGAYEASKAAMTALRDLGISQVEVNLPGVSHFVFKPDPDLVQNSVFVIGEAGPVEVPPGYTVEDARKRILNGESSMEVLMDFQRVYGVSGIMSDFALQAAFDPWNYAPGIAGRVRAALGEKR